MTSNTTSSFGPIIAAAAASSVARAFLIAAAGYMSVRYRPKRGKGDPIVPPEFVPILARTNYLLLLCPLFYSAIGKSVTPSVLSGLWPVIVGFFVIIFVGISSSTALSFLPGFRFLRRKSNRRSFHSLRIAAALPNAVSLPLIIFPSLCEYDIVYEAFADASGDSPEEMMDQCTERANVMIFLCQFAFCVYLFCMGQKTLLGSSPSAQSEQETQETPSTSDNGSDKSSKALLSPNSRQPRFRNGLKTAGVWLKEVFGNPGSIAMMIGLVTGCMPWLPSALFEPGGSLRFLGGALEALGDAATPVSLLVVGASLYDEEDTRAKGNDDDDDDESNEEEDVEVEGGRVPTESEGTNDDCENDRQDECSTSHCMSEETVTHIWLNLSRLVVAPAVVFSILIGLDCGIPGAFGDTIPHLYKMVMLVVSASPSAMTIIVLLKAEAVKDKSSNHASLMAWRIAKLYLPLYAISTITVACWSMAGLWISLPDEDGKYFCEA